MRIVSLDFLRLPLGGFRYKSNSVIFQKSKYKRKIVKVNKADVRSVPVTNTNDKNSKTSETVNRSPDYRENEMKIQMLSKHLHEQIFRSSKSNEIDKKQIERFDLLLNFRYSNVLLNF